MAYDLTYAIIKLNRVCDLKHKAAYWDMVLHVSHDIVLKIRSMNDSGKLLESLCAQRKDIKALLNDPPITHLSDRPADQIRIFVGNFL